MRALADLDVLIIDCQTTGASPAFGSVLELGWGVARANRAETVAARAHWIALPEGHVVPRQVQKITGYEPAHSAEAIVASDAWQRLRAAVQGAAAAPAAIHYARFELAFLRDWSARFEPETPFPIDAVCVHAIACRLYPDLPRQSLRALAGYLGHSLDLTRRSLGHVEATAFVWRKLCAELASREIESWEQLRAWLSERAPAKARPKKPKYPIATERYKALPDEPGVYRFLRSNGDVLYVGKAASLKKRVASHFLARAGTPQSPEMLTQVGDIQVTVVPSALEAAVLENETIKRLDPPYNVQLTASDPRVWYSSRDFDAAAASPGEQSLIGPLASEYSLRPLGALIALASGASASPHLRSQAVGVSDLWTPDESVFAAGWAELVRRHPAELTASSEDPRRRALHLAKKLLLARALTKAGEDSAALEAETAQKPEGWDPERVARHVERAAAQSYQTYRRARWLQLLHDSDVVYREPDSTRVRLLQVRAGELAAASDVARARLPPSRVRVPTALRAPAEFDRAKYDRLRILTTELKRIARDGGDVAVHFGPTRQIPAQLLAGVLRVI
ncbi:MAG TPA: GIY-YIG nuclease family protein [Polyangiaceae bacterium]|nr:GIY-YIG nuclease family protein [Polyangiaceae bacterium]